MSEGLGGGEGFAIDASVVKADATRARAIPGTAIDRRALGPVQATRAVREYLEGIAARDVRDHAQEHIGHRSGGGVDVRSGGPAFFAYSTNYLVDVRLGVIVDVEATSAHRTGKLTRPGP